MSDIFDTNKIDDLPDDFKQEVNVLNIRQETKMLLKLFEQKRQLSISEILVSLFRSCNLRKKRTWVSSTLYNLARRNIVKKLDGKRGIYEKID